MVEQTCVTSGRAQFRCLCRDSFYENSACRKQLLTALSVADVIVSAFIIPTDISRVMWGLYMGAISKSVLYCKPRNKCITTVQNSILSFLQGVENHSDVFTNVNIERPDRRHDVYVLRKSPPWQQGYQLCGKGFYHSILPLMQHSPDHCAPHIEMWAI